MIGARSRGGSLLLAAVAALLLAACGDDQKVQVACAEDSCSGHGDCSEANGAPECACDQGYAGARCEKCATGYQDGDGDGSCLADCSGMLCGAHGLCDASSGTASCVCESGWSGTNCDSCAAGYHSEGGLCIADGACLPTTCSGHGTCDASSGAPVCSCEAGYAGPSCAVCAEGFQDNDADGVCAPGCASAGLDCGAHGSCSDASGTAECSCNPGWTGEDCDGCAPGFHLDQGECVADAGCLPTTCGGHGTCSEASGTPVCTCEPGWASPYCAECAQGFQDHDGNGTCLADCATVALSCGAHGACSDESGEAGCVCETGWAGEACDTCAAGYHLVGQSCVQDTGCMPTTCNGHGTCSEASGAPVCTCEAGYAAPFCAGCAQGFQDNDGDGSCLADCASANLACGHGACSDESGTAACVCASGYAGALCDGCAAGFQDNDLDGTCLADCASASLACGAHGICSDASGMAACACDAGYEGAACDGCASGYQDNDLDGSCAPGCALTSLDCGAHGACDDTSGAAVCGCDLGYAGPLCGTCAAGYQDNDHDGACSLDCASAALACGALGACSDASGTAVCSCLTGYAGTSCELCAAGFQDNDSDGTCTADCASANLACGTHGSCGDASGTAICVCDLGYQGPSCGSCAKDYQDNDGDGICAPGCAIAAIDCGSHGSCSDATGAAACVCQNGYAGVSCDGCAAGYQDNDHDGLCFADCSSANLACGAHGQCADASGTAVCSCEAGYTGSACDACASGYQDNDSNGSCLPTCAQAGLTCSGNGSCNDAGGTATCLCDAGYQGADCADCAPGYTPDGSGGCVGGGNNCSTPLSLQLVTGTISGTNIGSGDDYTPGCQSTDSQEVVYQFRADTAVHVAFETSATFDTVMYLRSNCAGADLVCNDDINYSGGNANSHIEADLVPGTYYLFVDGFRDETGTFDLSITVGCPTGTVPDGQGGCIDSDPCDPDPCSGHGTCSAQGGQAVCACAPGYEGSACESCAYGYYPDGAGNCILGDGATCATAMPLAFATGSVTGSTVGAGNEDQPSCVSTNSEERVYVMQVSAVSHVVMEATGFDTILYVRGSCAGADLFCNDDYTALGRGSHLEMDLSPGTYYVFVDGYNITGTYTLSLQVASSCQPGEISDGQGGCIDDPCDPDPCTAQNTHCALALPSYTCECDAGYVPAAGGGCVLDTNPQGEGCNDALTLSGEGTVTGTTTDAVDDGTGSCVSSSAPARNDRVYTFTVTARTRYEFLMSGYDTVLHLRSVCADPSTQLACNDDSQGTAAGLTGFVDPGTYYLFADSYSSAGGSYTLDYKLRSDPCAADPCPGVPECVAQADWGGYECVCPAGTLPYGSSCTDDPCEPNPCTTVPNKGTCSPQLPGNYVCSCNPGYIDDGSGGCVTDPNANQWTFMVYLNGDNNLDSYGHTDIGEMGAAGSNDFVNIIVLQDSAGTGDSRMLRVTQGGYDVLQNLGEKDMGRWETLRDFGTWVIQNYPARHYALVMWDHGDGWKALPPALDPIKGFSNDDNGTYSGISISNGDYARALSAISTAAGGKLDLVGFDACLMGMYEVAKATAPYAHYFVGSEETEPGNGWAYDRFLPSLTTNYSMNGEQLGRAIVDAFYADSTQDSTLALSNLDTIPALDTALSTFADALRANSSLYSSINTVRNSTQAFYVAEHRDLTDFARRIAAMQGAPASLVNAANALQTQLRSTIVYNRAQSDYPNANGLAIYLPSTSDYFDSAYVGAGATWSTATTWDNFVQDFAR